MDAIKPQSPCIDCPGLKIGCSANCDNYILFQHELRSFMLAKESTTASEKFVALGYNAKFNG